MTVFAIWLHVVSPNYLSVAAIAVSGVALASGIVYRALAGRNADA